MDMDKISKVHFIGIGGIGMSACAKLMKVLEKEVTGSDVYPSEITEELEKMGVKIFRGHSFEQVPDDVDLIIYSSAVPEDNEERKRARELGVTELSYFEFLGEYSRDKFTIAISGTHGKSTTTAMLGKILTDAGLDPTVIVGSKLQSFEYGNFRYGKSKYFIVEACEYKANFLKLDPNVLIITNIEAEHLDYFKDLEEVAAAFQRLVDKLPEDGVLIYNADDPASVEMIDPRTETISYSLEKEASFEARNITLVPGSQSFDVLKDGEGYLANIKLGIPGKFNIYNALGAISTADRLGTDPEVIQRSLGDFQGMWRRMEVVGEYKGALIISDYGHHPTEVAGAIQAAKDFYPDKRIVWVYQPHHHNRTKELFNGFKKSFGGVDMLLVSDIYDVAGREEAGDQDIHSRILAKEIESVSPNIEVHYVGDLKQTRQAIDQYVKAGDVVVLQGAGTIDEIARDLIK